MYPTQRVATVATVATATVATVATIATSHTCAFTVRPKFLCRKRIPPIFSFHRPG
jgi:hypothetical protein